MVNVIVCLKSRRRCISSCETSEERFSVFFLQNSLRKLHSETIFNQDCLHLSFILTHFAQHLDHLTLRILHSYIPFFQFHNHLISMFRTVYFSFRNEKINAETSRIRIEKMLPAHLLNHSNEGIPLRV